MKPNKYRKKLPARVVEQGEMDVYDVLVTFRVTCPAVQHAVKKLLCPGERGHKDRATDLREALVSIERAVQLETDAAEYAPSPPSAIKVQPLDIPAPTPQNC